MKKFTLLFLLTLSIVAGAAAQMMPKRPAKKVYISTDFDLFLLSSSILEKPGMDRKLTVPRFTAKPFLGINFNYDFGSSVGIFTGVSIKNMGFIEKFDNPDSTVKRRVYTIGAPLGIKIGDVKYGGYVILGVGADFPFHYKEKGYIKRNNKTKTGEWFSDRTPHVMPYAFIGAHLVPILTVKLQYYPANFLNQDYVSTDASGNTVKPYAGYNVSTLMVTAGIDIPYSPRN
ncbi:MAG: hypothetical protein EOO01_20700 [Chitinophagaceae bacterium]|nr:MAG: hypothetical protein EOO01_20700 [Chitinophagaceae bacterium]